MRESKTLFHTNKPPEINWTAHKSAWESELGWHISALRSDLCSAMPGPGCLVSSCSSARNGSSDCSQVKGSVTLSLILAEEHLSSAESTIARNRLKINQRQLSWSERRDQPQVSVCHKLLCICYAMEFPMCMLLAGGKCSQWESAWPARREIEIWVVLPCVLWDKSTQPGVHWGMLKLRCLLTNYKWAPGKPNHMKNPPHMLVWKEIALLLFQRISEPTTQSFGGGYWVFTEVSTSYTKSEDIVRTVHL